ncbi:alpha/beta fold hydrolase [Longispora albida]|uniref:alpha/beta fold hydrolase n=1 Tax=Longispora albida TaxID=203523 RepID=UPI00037FE77A|nr:alpha/beta fold hydrolase [Longispora albida]
MSPDSIVFGAAGFIGRSLVAELLGQGRHVAAALRPGSEARLTSWLSSRGTSLDRLTVVHCDITEAGLGLPAAGFDGVRDVYNSAAAFAWGLAAETAYQVNVTGALNVLEWAAERPGLRRLVHITGYRASVKENSSSGGYESSKLAADIAVTARAAELGVPLTIANPSTVIGPGQYIGLADIVADLWHGRLPALPGGRDTFVPVVTIDYFAAFLATLPERTETAGQSYTVLDPATPNLPDLVRLLADHLGVRAPRLQIPVGVIRRLPRALTRAEPETLTFLSDDRYDTSAADAHARVAGLRMPPVEESLRDWADHLVASRFGTAATAGSGRFRDGTWLAGDQEHPEHVLLHGVPVDSDSWTEVATALHPSGPGEPGWAALRADLPGLGRSAPSPKSLVDWLEELMRPVTSRPVLVAHSLACEPAVRYALTHPDRISRLVLVAPAFLQDRASLLSRSPLAVPALRRIPAARLAALLGIPEGTAADSAAANLGRPGAARRVVRALRAASSPARRAEAQNLLRQLKVPVSVLAGEADPLRTAAGYPVTVIAGAGHYPQISHPAEVARALTPLAASLRP